MFRKLISIILLLFLSSGYAQADLESAETAYLAGNYETAFKEYLPLAEKGNALAQYNLGFMYGEGLGVTQDYAEALKWYHKAVAQGFAGAQTNLGFMYGEGLGVTQDDTEALKWYRKAAEQDNAEALNNLGLMYAKGEGVTRYITPRRSCDFAKRRRRGLPKPSTTLVLCTVKD